MEFNEKLQRLRAQRNLTQEQLAKQLYVSRAAISKWESGKGYPNIESLKCISKLFSVSIDELLSGEELISLAETENSSNMQKVYNMIGAVLDLMAIMFIIFPLYGKTIENYIYSVNLLSFTETTSINLAIYWSIFIALISIGIAKLIFIRLDKELLCIYITKCSVALSIAAICFFSMAKEPYVTTFLFLIFTIKIFVLLKQCETK
ncbi:hypothetical protein UT300019_11410 [Clostridium sp. CTA-19]